jgi:hypothetical protein
VAGCEDIQDAAVARIHPELRLEWAWVVENRLLFLLDSENVVRVNRTHQITWRGGLCRTGKFL